MKATVTGKQIEYNGASYRLNQIQGTWQVLMYGSFPFQSELGLTWRWVDIAIDRVPAAVIKESK